MVAAVVVIAVPVVAVVVNKHDSGGAPVSWAGVVDEPTTVTLSGLPKGTVRLAVSAQAKGPVDVVVCGGRTVTDACAHTSVLHADDGKISGVVEVSVDKERAVTLRTVPAGVRVAVTHTDRKVSDTSARGRVPVPDASTDPTGESTDELTQEPTEEPASDPTTTAPPKSPDPSGPTSVQSQMEADVLAVTNAERKRAGLGALSTSSCATNQARQRASQLVAENKFEHYPLEPIMDACKTGVGENLALGYSNGAGVVDGWMNSQGHRENLLRKTFVSMGVSCQMQNGRWLCAAVYLTA